MQVTTYVYPWDVDGDPSAADRIAGLGTPEVTLAAAYHAVRAVTTFHPAHRIVTRNAAVYHRPDPARWSGSPLRPAEPDPPGSGGTMTGLAGSFERSAERLRAAGLRVSAWVVIAHNDLLAATHPEHSVRNAYGDRYPWALCIGQPEVGRYAATLAAEIAALDCVDAVELEACGWYGFDHASTHDKTGGRPPAGMPGWLLDVCFCDACRATFAAAGADPEELAGAIAAALDTGYRRAGETSPGGRLPADLVELAGTVRATAAEAFLRRVVAAVRQAAPGKDVLVHAHPDPWEAGANPGFDPAVLLGDGGADGIVLACPGSPEHSAELVKRTRAAADPGVARVAATLTAVTAVGGRPGELGDQARAVLAAGATRLGLYHAGLASPTELSAIRHVIEATRLDHGVR